MVKKITKNIGMLLLENGLITPQQLERAQQDEGGSEGIHRILIRLGYVTEEVMADFISSQASIPRIELGNLAIDPKIIALIPDDLAYKYQIIPVFKTGNNVTCAMVDIFNVYALDEISLKTGLTVEPAITTEKEIKKALTRYYFLQKDMGQLRSGFSPAANKPVSSKNNSYTTTGVPEMAEDAPVIRFVNSMIANAVSQGASDIHIEPEENNVNVRYRVDGLLLEQPMPPKEFQPAIISRVKVMADLNISESRLPQDGRFKMNIEGEKVDIRVSSLPTNYGENLVLRLLMANNIFIGLEEIGLRGPALESYKTLLNKSNGIILVTGPTGSGKTTTLYSSIRMINSTEKSIHTVEDPVEYRLPGIRQTQVDPMIGLTFASGLRAILRQDPNIIMVGEIRDAETAQVAIQAALTGHLVLATLHTNSAAGAVTRLLDIGVEPFLVASSVIGVAAQRLVRLTCIDCKAKGCTKCNNTGYRGRTGIFEIMIPNEQIRSLITQKRPMEEIHNVAVQSGMKSLREDGLDKVAAGLTTKEEILRVT